MECPKCGNCFTIRKPDGSEFCTVCNYVIKKPHQQRLDKVLSKFEENVYGSKFVFVTEELFLEYRKEFNLFILCNEQEETELLTLSLNTVESLLADLDKDL